MKQEDECRGVIDPREVTINSLLYELEELEQARRGMHETDICECKFKIALALKELLGN